MKEVWHKFYNFLFVSMYVYLKVVLLVCVNLELNETHLSDLVTSLRVFFIKRPLAPFCFNSSIYSANMAFQFRIVSGDHEIGLYHCSRRRGCVQMQPFWQIAFILMLQCLKLWPTYRNTTKIPTPPHPSQLRALPLQTVYVKS